MISHLLTGLTVAALVAAFLAGAAPAADRAISSGRGSCRVLLDQPTYRLTPAGLIVEQPLIYLPCGDTLLTMAAREV